jgi:adenylate cyclase class 2
MVNNKKEVERRYRLVREKGEVTEILLSSGYEFRGSVMETDTYFQSPVRDFIVSRECLRIRETNGTATLTWKPPTTEEMSKESMYWKEELDIHLVEQGNKASRLLQLLGFEVYSVVEKNRDIYQNSQGVSVCIDQVEGVGHFVEIEKITENVPEAIRELAVTASLLKMREEDICTLPYRDLVVENI